MIFNTFSCNQTVQNKNLYHPSKESTLTDPFKQFYNYQQNFISFNQSKNHLRSPYKQKSIKFHQIPRQKDDFQKLLQKIQKVKQQYKDDQKNNLIFNHTFPKQTLSFKKKPKSRHQSPQLLRSPRKIKTLCNPEPYSIFDKQNNESNKNIFLKKLSVVENFKQNKQKNDKKGKLLRKNLQEKFQMVFKQGQQSQKQSLLFTSNNLKLEKNNPEQLKIELRMKILIDSKILQKAPVHQSINFDAEILAKGGNNFTECKIKQDLKFSDFQIGSCIGSGKFGQVYLCRHKKTNFICALKKILKSTIQEYKMIDQFIRELKISYMVNHPNVVKTYAHFDDEFHIFILMEYASHGNVMDKLEEKKGEQFSSKVLFQTMKAIEHIHQLKIVHRDLKPENIVVFFQDTFKLCDFGLSTFVSNDMKHTFCGTLDYVSPQMKDVGQYDLSVDLWSLGVLAFQLIFGEAPFKNKISEWKKTGYKKSKSWKWKIQYPRQASLTAKDFIQNLLKQKPQQRSNLKKSFEHEFIKNTIKRQQSIKSTFFNQV